MARKVLVRLVDDLDGLPSEGVATVTFSLDRVTYQIDLNESNASKLRDGLAGFIAAARRTGGRVKRGTVAGTRSAGAANDGPVIREWAREQGHQLAERGRIPSHIVDAFRAAGRGARAKVAEVAPVSIAPAAKPTRTPRKVAAKTAAASRTTATATATRSSRTRTAAPKTAATAPKTAAKAAPKAKATTRTAAAKTTAAKATTAKTAAPKATTTRAAAKPAASKAAPKASAAKASTTKAAPKAATGKTVAGKAAKSTTAKSTTAKAPRTATRRSPASKAR